MKIWIVIIALIISANCVEQININDIPEEELRALEDKIKFKKAKAEAIGNAQSENIFSSLFGGKEAQGNKLQFSKIQN